MSQPPAGRPPGPDDEAGLTPAWDPARPPAPPELRASDHDRERVVTLLRDHYAAGRITFDELAERAEVALQARTHAELDEITADLIARPQPAPPPEPLLKQQGQWTLAILSTQRRRGRWRIGDETGALAICGTCQLDLREVQLPASGVAQLNVVAIMGNVDIVVPEGVDVDLDGFALMGSNDCRTRAETIPGLPRVRVQAFSLMGSVVVRNPSRREARRAERRALREGSAGSLPPSRDRDDARRHARERALEHREAARDLRRETRERRRETREDRDQARIAGRDFAEEMREKANRLRDELADAHRAGTLDFDTVRSAIGGVIESIVSSVQDERPDLGPHVAPDGTVTILFSDIEGFTELTERLGDLRAQDLLRDHNTIVAEQVTAHGGYKVKDAGDGVMVVFDSARRAVRCARDVHRAFDRYSSAHPDTPVRVRIGMHTGEVIREKGPDDRDDFYGRNVILAARIAQQAAGGDLLVSALVRELVVGSAEFAFSEPRELELKGLSGVHRIYPVEWAAAPRADF